MTTRFDPSSSARDWYWAADDGRVYGTKAGAIVDASDPAFTAWVSAGNVATLWPRNPLGEQTSDALDALLAFYKLPLSSPPGVADLLAHASAAQSQVLAQVWSFDLAASGGPAHVVTTRLDPDGERAMMKIALWAQLNAASADARLSYSNVDYGGTTLNPAEADTLAAKAGEIDARSYAILNQVAARITASPPTLTTFAAIDDAFAALASAP